MTNRPELNHRTDVLRSASTPNSYGPYWPLTNRERAQRQEVLRHVAENRDGLFFVAAEAMARGASVKEAQFILGNKQDGQATQIKRALAVVLGSPPPQTNDNVILHAINLLEAIRNASRVGAATRRDLEKHLIYLRREHSAASAASSKSIRKPKSAAPTSHQWRAMWEEDTGCLGDVPRIARRILVAQFLFFLHQLVERPGRVSFASVQSMQQLLAVRSPHYAYVYVLQLWFLPIFKIGSTKQPWNRFGNGTDFGLGWALRRVNRVPVGTQTSAESLLREGVVNVGGLRMRDLLPTAGKEWVCAGMRLITCAESPSLKAAEVKFRFHGNLATQLRLLPLLKELGLAPDHQDLPPVVPESKQLAVRMPVQCVNPHGDTSQPSASSSHAQRSGGGAPAEAPRRRARRNGRVIKSRTRVVPASG